MSDFILPEELMMQIWLGLHIKSTVRFRSVAKSWYASLSDPHFIYKNLTFFNAQSEQDLFLALHCKSRYYSVVSHETLVASAIQESKVPKAEHLDSDHVQTYSCDDLVCFHFDHGEFIGVWNLTTGETKILPPVSNDGPPTYEFLALGFGFDDKIQDYKIVQIGTYHGEILENEAYVYSLRSCNNCWRKLDKPNLPSAGHLEDPWYANAHSYRDGIFYWFDDDLISFDMSTEVFNRISLLELPHRLPCLQRSCKLKDGSMFIITYTYDDRYEDDIEEYYDLWVLLELGVASSLMKLFRIDWHCGNEVASPLGFWGNNLVFQYDSNHRLLIGDPTNGEPKEVQIDGSHEIVNSLVWTKGKNTAALN